jgi:hypothetical protein
MLGAAETAAILARKRNRGDLTTATFAQAMTELRAEVLDAPAFAKLPADNALIGRSLALLDRYAVNANDAIVLQLALEIALPLRAAGDEVVLVASDQRLLRAAQAEGVTTFDPETQTRPDLNALLAP